MSGKKSIWCLDQWEREKENDHMGPEKMAHFGYRKVPEGEKVRWVMRHFNTVARKYDLMNTLLSFGIHHLWKRAAVKMLKLHAGNRVIDICGGTGDLSILAANAVGSSGRVILYDINRAMMEVGRSKVAKSIRDERIRYVQGNAEEISFRDQGFDAAMVGFGIRNLTHMEQGLKEIHRVLKRGGKLMCLEFSKPTAPLFRWLYDMYSFHIMPTLGGLIVGSKQAYTYLPESIRLFPSAEELSATLENSGFSQVSHRKLTNGIAVIHLGMKE
ncbi:MAG: bifunctional demethylmenaquinone methyltransferase/2-methoxy-6-polyprenyl-1,4-benzoquinol methylase UbiE [Desulfobacteraceae bacterium]|jgi:demethylmenaquinone methyltransferase/2-methoxy-6-polyprenyl-1,4-benzoquinol methylase